MKIELRINGEMQNKVAKASRSESRLHCLEAAKV